MPLAPLTVRLLRINGDPIQRAVVQAVRALGALVPDGFVSSGNAEGVTDNEGRYVFNLVPGGYALNARDAAGAWILQDHAVTLTESGYVLEDETARIPERVVPFSFIDTSTIVAFVTRLDGTPLTGASITVELSDEGDDTFAHIASVPVRFDTDHAGFSEMRLWRNTGGVTYTITCTHPDYPDPIFSETGVTVGAVDQTLQDLLETGNTNAIPEASFSLASNYDIVDYSISVTASASDPDGTIVAYHWSVDGVTVGASALLSYTITVPGVHSIRLTVTDDDGAIRSFAQSVTLVEGDAQLAAATTAVETAESSTLQADIDTAQVLVTALPDTPLKDTLQNRLDAIVVGSAAATAAVVALEANPIPENQTSAQTLVTALADSSVKTSLQSRIDAQAAAVATEVANRAAAETAVSNAEAQQTPENQATAQTAVGLLGASAVRDAFQSRVDALDDEIDDVLEARALVNAAEAYTWLASEQAAAQSAVDALQSTTEQTALTTRLDALDDKVAAEAGVVAAEVGATQVLVDAAQLLIDALDVGDRAALQARLDAVFVAVRLVHQNDDPGGWANRPAESPFLSPSGFLVRSPGLMAKFALSETISSGSGWHCVRIQCAELSTSTHVAVGIPSEALAAADLAVSTDRLLLIGEFAAFDGSDVVGYDMGLDDYVLAIDYRGTNPIVHIIAGGVVLSSSTLVTSTDINIAVKCDYQAIRGWTYEVNTGSDLANRPFPTTVASALTAAAVDTTGLVLGWGGASNTGTTTAPASITIAGAPATPTVGTPITLTATCIDADGVDQSANVYWYNEALNWNESAAFDQGASYTFTPSTLSYNPIRCVYYDPQGRAIEVYENILVDGAVTQNASTVWDAVASHPNVAAIATNQARFGGEIPFKMAVIANQAVWGEFKYFELTHVTLDAAANFGFGVTTELNGNIMWGGRDSGEQPTDGAGSFSVLEEDIPGFGPLVWNNGTTRAAPNGPVGVSPGATGWRFNAGTTIGFAIDSRDRTADPIVYIIALDHATSTSAIFGSFRLRLAYAPLLPMVYVNLSSTETTGFDVAVNGGATPFVHDPRPLFTALGVDQTGFEYGWADAEIQT